MGGRGASSASGMAASASGSSRALDSKLISRANASSPLADAGNRIKREFEQNVAEIKSMSLSDADKKSAISEQRALADNALKVHAENPNPFATGRARINAAKAHSAADKAASAEMALSTHMESLRRQQAESTAKAKRESRAEIIQNALANGDMSVVIDGVTWTRKTKRSRSFTRVD